MRKQIVFCVLSLCMALTGCTGTLGQTDTSSTDVGASTLGHTDQNGIDAGTTVPILGDDAQNKYRADASRTVSFQETEDYFCGSGFIGRFIYYYDKANGISGVLCADPSCLHESSTCGAYADYGSFFCNGEGKCYWIGKDEQGEGQDDYLWSGDLAGTNRKKVKRLSFEDIILKYQPQYYEIHRGRFYIIGQNNIVDGVSTSQRVTLLSSPLDNSEVFTALFDKTFDRNVHPSVRFIGDDVYLTLQIFPEGGPFDVVILRIDTKSGEIETVYEETGMTASIGPAWVTEQGEIYFPGRNDSSAYIWKLENGKRTEVFSWQYTNPSCPGIFDGIAVFIYRIDHVRWVDILNLSGETIYSGKLLPESIPGIEGNPNEYSYAVIGGDSEKIILNLQSFTGSGLIDHTIILDLNENMKPTVLWSTQQ